MAVASLLFCRLTLYLERNFGPCKLCCAAVSSFRVLHSLIHVKSPSLALGPRIARSIPCIHSVPETSKTASTPPWSFLPPSLSTQGPNPPASIMVDVFLRLTKWISRSSLSSVQNTSKEKHLLVTMNRVFASSNGQSTAASHLTSPSRLVMHRHDR